MPTPSSPSSHHAPLWRWPLAGLVTATVFLGMDAVWLGTATQALYQPAIGHLMAPAIDWTAVALFYPLYIAGLVFFAEAPALAQARSASAGWRGAAVGLLAYATYDLTNQATLSGWPWWITAIDLAWGAFASGMAAWAGTAATRATCRRASRTSGR